MGTCRVGHQGIRLAAGAGAAAAVMADFIPVGPAVMGPLSMCDLTRRCKHFLMMTASGGQEEDPVLLQKA